MINFLGYDIFGLIKSGIGTAISAGIRTIFFEICGFVYELIIGIYDVFLALCKAQILDIDIISGIAQRVGLILGLVMFFMVSFSFIQMVLDPDKIIDKEKGAVNIVKKVLIVIVMFGMSSFVFDKLQDIQSIVIENGILNRILLPSGYNVNSDDFGKVLSTNLFMSFYSPKELAEDDATASDDYKENYDYCVIDYANFENVAIEYGNFSSNCVTTAFKFTDEEKATDRFTFVMNFNYILCLLVGVFVCYFFIMYTISIGMRVIQLTFLQMISPMAFIAYLSPKKDNLFSKWLKTYVMTYLDVFIRIAIISLGSFLISILMDSWTDITAAGDSFGSVFWHSVSNGGTIRHPLYIKIIMIMAILSFMKKAPELIKQLIPSTGAAGTLSYGFSAKDRTGFGMVAGGLAGFTVGTIGRIPGMVGNVREAQGFSGKARALRNGLAGVGLGAITGVARGGHAGYGTNGAISALTSAASKQGKANLARSQRLANGIGFREYIGNNVRGALGVEAQSARDERNITTLSNYSKMQDVMESYANNNKEIKKLKRAYEAIQQAGRQIDHYDAAGNAIYETDEQFTNRIEDARKAWANSRDSFIEAAIRGETTFQLNGVTENINVNNDGLYSSIQSTRDEMNRMLSENEHLFNGFKILDDHSTFSDLDTNIGMAKTREANLKANQRRKMGN